jgi:hypothetical protein
LKRLHFGQRNEIQGNPSFVLGNNLPGLGLARPSFEKFGGALETMDREWNIT